MASMKESIEEELTCSVCLEQYKDPRVLPCLHTFCRECLERVFCETENVSKITCPNCREESSVPVGGIANIHHNYIISNILSIVGLHADTGSQSILCDNCESGDIAISRCITCARFLCEFCQQAHQRVKDTKNHSVMSVEEVLESGRYFSTSASITCEHHEGETLRLYCHTCTQPICRDCAILEHKQHAYSSIKEAYEESKSTIEGLISECQTQANALDQAAMDVNSTKKKIEECVKEVSSNIERYFVHRLLDIEKEKAILIGEVTKLKEGKIQRLDNQLDELHLILGKIRSCVSFTQNAVSKGSQTELMEMKPDLVERLETLQKISWDTEPWEKATIRFREPEVKNLSEIELVSCVWDAGEACVHLSEVRGPGLTCAVKGKKAILTIISKDFHGEQLPHGSDKISLRVQGIENLHQSVKDCENGVYNVSYLINQTGNYHLHVTLNDGELPGSPFSVKVVPWLLDPSTAGRHLTLSEDLLSVTFGRKLLAAESPEVSKLPTRPTAHRQVRRHRSLNVMSAANQLPGVRGDTPLPSGTSKWIVRIMHNRGGVYFGLQDNDGRVLHLVEISHLGVSIVEFRRGFSGESYLSVVEKGARGRTLSGHDQEGVKLNEDKNDIELLPNTELVHIPSDVEVYPYFQLSYPGESIAVLFEI